MLSSILLLAAALTVHSPDTLQSASIIAERGYTVSRADTLQIDRAAELSDILASIPGINLSDNGGHAALKSINFRGLGSSHTGIFVDGIRLSNLQSGQAELGFLDLGQYSSMQIDYADNSLRLISAKPQLTDRKAALGAELSYSSFSTLNSRLRLDFRPWNSVVMRVSGSYLSSEGDFPYGDGSIRLNNDIQRYTAGLDLWGRLYNGEWQLKAFGNSSDRGTPGSCTWPSEDRQKDHNIFMQGSLDKRFSELYALKLSAKLGAAKAAWDEIDYMSSWGNSEYKASELQFNSTHSFKPGEHLDISASASAQWNRLRSNVYEASRLSLISAVAAIATFGQFEARAALEYTGNFEAEDISRQVISPRIGVSLDAGHGLSFNALSSRSFRNPSFNELYYPGFGNPALRPENIWINDLGAAFHKSIDKKRKLSFKLNFFHHSLKDKIVSAPSQEDPNIWLPYNVEQAESKGLDASASARWQQGDSRLSLSLSYSFQESDLVYVYRHAATASLKAVKDRWKGELEWLIKHGRQDAQGELPGWNTLNLSLSREFKTRDKTPVTLLLRAVNLADYRYESVRYYPMPGRSLSMSIMINL